MIARVLLLAAVLLALLAVDSGQRDDARAGRAESLRVRRLVPDEVREGHPVAVVRVQDGDGRAQIYGRQQGLWRCLSWRGAPAQGDRLEQLITDMYETQGVVLSTDPARPQDYGLDVPSMRTVSLHGPAMNPQDPSADLVVSVEVGAPVVGADGCYARLRGERAIWTIDADPGAVTGREPTARPSLVDPALVPGTWPGASPRIKTISVAHAGADEFDLELREVEISPEDALAGKPGFEWIMERGGREEPTAGLLAASFANHALTATWTDVLDPALAPALGFDPPRATLTLWGGGPEPLRLSLGGRTPAGRTAVLNHFSQIVFEIEPAEEARLFPRPEALLPSATVNPWDLGRGAAPPPGLPEGFKIQPPR
jgi:hypothetical protein